MNEVFEFSHCCPFISLHLISLPLVTRLLSVGSTIQMGQRVVADISSIVYRYRIGIVSTVTPAPHYGVDTSLAAAYLLL